ncbi:hypothetical protein CHS0354_038398 [Potamilus streckersoni]|uniref:NEDD1 n=1 Tax=Potamilus streckersoni TaxID=2493646 RepID=A0AAE0S5U8_9BIVA|nr:hypothetical protein CHS0354_038398 [Potamilus streckersoni]
MAVSELKLASSGDDIKIWDCSLYSVVQEFNPHDQNVASIGWNSDNSILASVSMHHDKIALTSVKNSAVTLSEVECSMGRLCIDLNNTSRYIIAGGSDGTIGLWDLKFLKLKKTYKDHKGPVTCAQFNWNSTVIASGSETGEIILHNVVTGQGTSPLIASRIQAVRQLQYCKLKKSLLGAVSDDGSLNLWDSNTRQMIHGFSDSHRAPATGLVFSPINDILLMSIGLDKRIVCYDLQAKKPVKIMSTESPLTSIDAMSDGITFAVGSTRGKIHVYDLRHGSVPIRIINAHKSSVQGLKFQLEASNSITGKSSHSPGSKHRQLPLAPDVGTSKLTKGQPNDIRQFERQSVADGGYAEDIFSPIREGEYSGDGLDLGRNSSLMTHSYDRNLSITNNQSRNNAGDGYADGVFSPLSDNNIIRTGNSVGISPLAQLPSPSRLASVTQHHWSDGVTGLNRSDLLSDPVHASPSVYNIHGTSNGEENFPIYSKQSSLSALYATSTAHTPSGLTTDSDVRRSYHQELSSSSSSSSVTDSPEGGSKDTVPHYRGISTNLSTPIMSQLQESSGAVAGGIIETGMSKFSHKPLTPEGVNAQSLHLDERQDASMEMSDKSESQNFQTQFIRNLIHEEMEEFRDQMHKEMTNLHLQMLRQFEIQQTEIRSLIQQFSVNEELVAEVERLREEVKRLKKNF